jgi:hypothetical protein
LPTALSTKTESEPQRESPRFEVRKEYNYNGKKVVRKYTRKTDKVYKAYNPRYRDPEPGEVKKEYMCNGKKVTRYYKVKNARNISTGESPEPVEVKKEYMYNGKKVIRYYKVKNARNRCNISTGDKGESPEQDQGK